MASTRPSIVLALCFFLIACHTNACHTERFEPLNQIILSGERDLWHIQGPFSLSHARHHSLATITDWRLGKVVAQCALGSDLLDVKLSPEGQHIAWLDRKTLYIVDTQDCQHTAYAWSTLWPSAPPAPVQIDWVDAEHVVSYSTPPLLVPIHRPDHSRLLGSSRDRPISAMHVEGTDAYCGDASGSVFNCELGDELWSLSERIVSVRSFEGQICALTQNRLRCGEQAWNIADFGLRYPQFTAVGQTLWVQDRGALGSHADMRWFPIDPEKGLQPRIQDRELAWPTQEGWIKYDGDKVSSGQYSIPRSSLLSFFSGTAALGWIAEQGAYLYGHGAPFILRPESCSELLFLGARPLCVQDHQLRELATGEILVSFESYTDLFTGNNRLAVVQRGQIQIVEASGHRKLLPIDVRHRVSAMSVRENEILVGTHTGSVLRWREAEHEWQELAAYPDDIVDIDGSGADVLVALGDAPFVILGANTLQKGATVASALASNGQRIAVAERYGSLYVLNEAARCPHAFGVSQLEWIGDNTLAWGGLSSGVWTIGQPCRRVMTEGEQLLWVDSKTPVQAADLGR